MSIILAICACVIEPPVQQDRDALRAIGVSYRANRDRIVRGQSHFTISQGFADNEANARLGKLSEARTADGYFAFKMGLARFDRTYPLEVMAKETKVVGSRQLVTPYTTVRSLTDGRNSLIISGHLAVDLATQKIVEPLREQQKGVVRKGTNNFYRELEFPLRPGHPEGDLNDVSAMIARAESGEEGWSVGSVNLEAAREGHEVAEVVFKREGTTSTYVIDMCHGSLPLRVHTVEKDASYSVTTWYDDIHDLGQGAFLPYQETIYFSDGITKRFVITEFVAGDPPASAFTIKLPRPIQVTDTARKMSLASRDTFGLDELRGARKPGDHPFRLVQSSPGGEGELSLPGELEPSPPWRPWAIGAGILLVLAIILTLGSRIRGRRS